MFDGLKRKLLLRKAAGILEGISRRLEGTSHTSGDEKVLGWTMNNWKLYLEGGALAAVGAALGIVVDKLNTFAACLNTTPPVPCVLDWKSIGIAAAAGAIGALAGWFRMAPKDPRRAE